MTTQPRTITPPEEYLEAERQAETKSELHAGEIRPWRSVNYSHNLIVANVLGLLGVQLRGQACTVLPSNLRVWVEASSSYFYPDVTVVCGAPRFTDATEDTLSNPTLLVEVLSKSSSNYDRGDEFESYRALDTFREYVLIAQDRPHSEHYVRQSNGSWILTEENRLDVTVPLTSIDCELDLRGVYDKVSFGPRPV